MIEIVVIAAVGWVATSVAIAAVWAYARRPRLPRWIGAGR